MVTQSGDRWSCATELPSRRSHSVLCSSWWSLQDLLSFPPPLLSLSVCVWAHRAVGGALWSHLPFRLLREPVQRAFTRPAVSALLFILKLNFILNLCMNVQGPVPSAGCLLSPSTSSLGRGLFTEARARCLAWAAWRMSSGVVECGEI